MRNRDRSAGAAELRGHRPEDEGENIDWKASARRGSLVVREYGTGREEAIEVVLDRMLEEEAFEEALRQCAFLAGMAEVSGGTLRIHDRSGTTTYGPGHQHWSKLWYLLAGIEGIPEGAASPWKASAACLRLPLGRDQA